MSSKLKTIICYYYILFYPFYRCYVYSIVISENKPHNALMVLLKSRVSVFSITCLSSIRYTHVLRNYANVIDFMYIIKCIQMQLMGEKVSNLFHISDIKSIAKLFVDQYLKRLSIVFLDLIHKRTC